MATQTKDAGLTTIEPDLLDLLDQEPGPPNRLKSAAIWTVPIVIFMILWELEARAEMLDPALLPPPTVVADALWALIDSGELWPHVAASAQRGGLGFLIAATVSVPLGVLIGWIRPVEHSASPLIEVFRQLPSLAMFPVFLLMFGIGYRSQLAMVVWASSWPILLTTISGTKSIDQRLVKAARTFGAQPKDLFLRVAIPSAVPHIATGLRLGGSFAFLVLVGAEMIGASSGIGYLVISSQYLFRIPTMYAALVVLAVFGLTLNFALLAAEQRIARNAQ